MGSRALPKPNLVKPFGGLRRSVRSLARGLLQQAPQRHGAVSRLSTAHLQLMSTSPILLVCGATDC